MTLKERIRARVFNLLGLVQQNRETDEDRLMFINDSEQVKRMKLKEYNVWYDGDGVLSRNSIFRQTIKEKKCTNNYHRKRSRYLNFIQTLFLQALIHPLSPPKFRRLQLI